MTKLKKWNYPKPSYYLGFTPDERILGWQILWGLRDAGTIIRMPESCCICSSTKSINYHNENYYQITEELYSLCQGCHFRLHRRFRSPESWREIVEKYGVEEKADAWFTKLNIESWDKAQYLRDKHGEDIKNIVQNLLTSGVIKEDCELLALA